MIHPIPSESPRLPDMISHESPLTHGPHGFQSASDPRDSLGTFALGVPPVEAAALNAGPAGSPEPPGPTRLPELPGVSGEDEFDRGAAGGGAAGGTGAVGGTKGGGVKRPRCWYSFNNSCLLSHGCLPCMGFLCPPPVDRALASQANQGRDSRTCHVTMQALVGTKSGSRKARGLDKRHGRRPVAGSAAA